MNLWETGTEAKIAEAVSEITLVAQESGTGQMDL